MKKCLCGIISLMILSTLCVGCGKKKDDSSDISNDFSGISGSGDLSDNDLIVPKDDFINYVVSNGSSKIVVNADIISDGIENATIYNMKYNSIDDDMLISMAERIFDDSEYTIKVPAEISSKSIIDTDLSYINNLIQNNTRKEDVFLQKSWSYKYLEHYYEDFNPDMVDEPKDGKVIYEINTKYKQYETGRIWGKIDGNDFELYYMKSEDETVLQLERLDMIPAKSNYLAYNPNDDTEDVSGYVNYCDYNKAKETASDFMLQLGFEDYDVVASFNTAGSLLDPTLDDSYYIDGYRLEYTTYYNGIFNSYGRNQTVTAFHDSYDENSYFANQPNVQINIDSDGIYRVIFSDIYTPDEELSEDTSMLSFEKVDSIAQNCFRTQSFENCEIKSIVFENVVVNYKSEYVSVPAWVYYKDTNTNRKEALIGINALDGDVLYFGISLNQNPWFNYTDSVIVDWN